MRAWRTPPGFFGSSVKSVDDKAALSIAGVKQTENDRWLQTTNSAFQALGGVAVLADNTWAAMQGKKKTEDRLGKEARTAAWNSDDYKKELQETARQAGEGCAPRTGNVDEAFAKGGKNRRSGILRPVGWRIAIDGAASRGWRFYPATEKVEGMGGDAESAGCARCDRARALGLKKGRT